MNDPSNGWFGWVDGWYKRCLEERMTLSVMTRMSGCGGYVDGSDEWTTGASDDSDEWMPEVMTQMSA